jgi:hypothetical protein
MPAKKKNPAPDAAARDATSTSLARQIAAQQAQYAVDADSIANPLIANTRPQFRFPTDAEAVRNHALANAGGVLPNVPQTGPAVDQALAGSGLSPLDDRASGVGGLGLPLTPEQEAAIAAMSASMDRDLAQRAKQVKKRSGKS